MTNTPRPSPPGRIPERQCVTCRVLWPRTGLIRLVRLPDGTVMYDSNQSRHGRGAYACRQPRCLDLAVRKGGFARTLRTRISKELMDEVLALGLEGTEKKPPPPELPPSESINNGH